MPDDTAQPVVADQPVSAPAGDTEGNAVVAAEQPQQQTEGADAADETPAVELNEEQLKGWKDLPPAQRKFVNRLFTQKSQGLAEERKQLAQARQLAQAMELDPDTTIELLARHRGFKVEKVQQAAPQEQAAVDHERQALEAQFGPEAAALIVKVAEGLADKKAEVRVKPLLEDHAKRQQAAEVQETTEALEALSKEFPDWKNHEQAMSEISKKLQPGPGMNRKEYARALYLIANPNRTPVQQAKAVIESINKAARTSEPPSQSVSQARVESTLPKYATFEEGFRAAHEAAKRGE